VGARPIGGGTSEALEDGDAGVGMPPSQAVRNRQTVDACPDYDYVVDQVTFLSVQGIWMPDEQLSSENAEYLSLR